MNHLPLAEKIRPQNFDQIVGQEHLTGEKGAIREIFNHSESISMVLWGPPGTGKTTIARVFTQKENTNFVPLSAVENGVKVIRETAAKSRNFLKAQIKTVLFLDEIHHLNKNQQDALLPYLEDGTFMLIGATTENPSFSLNAALLSRVRVFLLKSLRKDDLEKIIDRYLDFSQKKIEEKARQFLISFANGDARILLSVLEATSQNKITATELENIAQEKKIRYDRSSDEHYWTISAFIKSMRASDAEAAVYYLARMLEGGEDPRFIARRMVIFASEDIGLADHQALPLAMAALEASAKIGMPEIRINLSHVCRYLSKAPKDNSSYLAINQAMQEVKKTGNLPIPLHLRNPSTKMLKEMGFGKGYIYPHDNQEKVGNKDNLPQGISDRTGKSKK